MPVDADDVVNVSLEDSKRLLAGVFIKRGRSVRIGAVDPHNQELLTFIEQSKKKRVGRLNFL